MIEAATAPGRTDNGRRPARRVELPDALRSYLRSKYLETTRDAAATGPVGTAMFADSLPLWVPGRSVRRPIGMALGLAVVLFALLALVGPAHADSLVLAQTGLVIGNQTAEYSINIPSSGTLDLQLQDFDWPSPLASMTLEIATPTTILQTLSGTGDLNLSLSGAGTYYAYVSGSATGALDIGAFGLLGNFEPLVAPVPLPASVSLLFAGLVATFWSLRRNGRKGGVPSVAAG
jgi:hypothetical protein